MLKWPIIKVRSRKSLRYTPLLTRHRRIRNRHSSSGPYRHSINPIQWLHLPSLRSNRERSRQIPISIRRPIHMCRSYNPINMGRSRAWSSLPLSITISIFRAHPRTESSHPSRSNSSERVAPRFHQRPKSSDLFLA
jgi:hypothetical protein